MRRMTPWFFSFSDSNCAAFDGTNAVAIAEQIGREADIVSVDFMGSSDVVFQRVTGDARTASSGCGNMPSGGGTITLQSRNGAMQRTIRLLNTGVISVE